MLTRAAFVPLTLLAVLVSMLAILPANAIDLTGFFLGGGHVKLEKNMFLTANAIIYARCLDKDGNPVVIDFIGAGLPAPQQIPFGAIIEFNVYGRMEGNYIVIYRPAQQRGKFLKDGRGVELPKIRQHDALSPYYERAYPSNVSTREEGYGEGKTTYTEGFLTLSWVVRGIKQKESKTSVGPFIFGKSKDGWEPLTFEAPVRCLPAGMDIADNSEENIACIKAWMYGKEIETHASASVPVPPQPAPVATTTVGLDPKKVDDQLSALWSKVNELTDGYNGIIDWIKAGENAPPSTVTVNGGSTASTSADQDGSITGDYRLHARCDRFWIKVYDSAHLQGCVYGPFDGPVLPMKGAEIAVVRDGVRSDVCYKIRVSADGNNWSEEVTYYPARTPDVSLPL